jgi:hypothetical protein
VLDESSDVLFVFNDENAVFGHGIPQRYRLEISTGCRTC